VTIENPLPNTFLEQTEPDIYATLGVDKKGFSKEMLETDLINLAKAVSNAGKQGTDTPRYRNALKSYQKKLAEVNRERGLRGQKPITSVDELNKSIETSSISELQNQLIIEQDLGNTNKVKEIEQAIAESQAILSSGRMTPTGLTGVTQAGLAGYVPDMQKGKPVLNEEMTFTIVGPDGKAVVANNRPLESVFLVFEDKNFYERGIKSTVKNITYRNADEIRSLAFSLDKNNRKKLQEEFKKLQLLPSDYIANGELDRNGEFENAFLQAHTFANRVNYQKLQNNQPILGLSDAIREYRTSGMDGGPQINVTLFNRDEVAATLDSIYLQSIGRKANKKEVDEFYRKVQKEAKAKPTVTTTTGRQTTTQRGFETTSLQRMAEAQAEARPEFLAYQLSTNFYNALLGASQLPLTFGAGEAPVTGPLG
jgi:hypothetical protein